VAPNVPDWPLAIEKNPRADVELKVKLVALVLVVGFCHASTSWIVSVNP